VHVKPIIFAGLLLTLSTSGHADRLAFGSFAAPGNAENWAQKLTAMFGQQVLVERLERPAGADQETATPLYRVVSAELDDDAFELWQRRAQAAGIQSWRLRKESSEPPPVAAQLAAPSQPVVTPAAQPLGGARLQPPSPVTAPRRGTEQYGVNQRYEWDLAVESRLFKEEGSQGQDAAVASVAVQLEYFRGWANDTRSLTVTPFVRIDSADDERTHADLREFYYSRIGQDGDLHIGARRVFWGVTEFHHLIDVVNQTDLIENIDGEDKLGQPMVQWSMVREWGMLDLYALLGFRERTFPGSDGRLRLPYRILSDATYASGAEQRRVDGAVRWSHYMGPFEIGVHHFSGTSREPILVPELGRGGEIVLRPHYPIIDQTGIDAQAFYGDWAFKLEGFTKSGFGERYAAANIGFERTFVGVLGSQADFGLVVEYLWDERGEDAFNTVFENDIALGGRFHLNDYADTKALLGVIVDTQEDDYLLSLEASRRLGVSWLMSLEVRLFGGGKTWQPGTSVEHLTDAEYKTAWLQDDDYLQLELKKFL
jgi:hypothetical protein